MYINILIKGMILVPILVLGTIPQISSAEESSSFKLYHEAPQYGERGPAASDSFKVNEDGVTWSAKPLTSDSFQIVSSPPTAAAATTPTPPAEEEEETTPPSGGSRGKGTTRPVKGVDPSDDEDGKPAAPAEEEKEIDVPKAPASYVESVQDGGAGYSTGESRTTTPRYFRGIKLAKDTKVIVVKEEALPNQVIMIIEQNRNLQIALMITQAISAICFLMAFRLLLTRVPFRLLKK
ncbi:MAG: hypothetical protein QF741_04595 [Candidatus Peribacteraceae bacterium]|jgi:hypothetical protein|nr:hypothetical protein [Candidatus Peribacteraceae bacterium]MDP7454783.1 hypothetical protein [Candidatus Peribacteraceae bacterium]MDP7646116.1 hypothetical protein [Candidatus Peribacteraceae bacterium]|tara:strand:- start:2041 stop:2748 length:708 start_codon:yes stop_codon:yes gene_type:complete